MLVTNSLRLPVTDQGVTIPKIWLGNAVEVDMRSINGEIVVVPVASVRAPLEPYGPEDSIWNIGKNPVDDEITDGSVNHDKYLYGDPHRQNG